MKLYQGIKKGGEEETDEVIVMFNRNEVRSIMEILIEVSEDPIIKIPMKKSVLKGRAKKVLKMLNDIPCF